MAGETAPELTCPYCQQAAELAYGVDVIPSRPDLAELPFWVCWRCDARVGCHPRTNLPLGTLADPRLRRMRGEVHSALDWHWKAARNKGRARERAYQRLARELSLSPEDCHVGLFDQQQCELALKVLEGWAREVLG